MIRLRNEAGVVVHVSDETAGRLGPGWTRVEEPEKTSGRPRKPKN